MAGRVVALRDFGGVVFADLRDWSGLVQVLFEVRSDSAAQPDLTAAFARDVDLGDLVRVEGRVGSSRAGAISVLAQGWAMLGKCLHPLPDKWRGLADPEAKVRQRYLDLAIDPAARDLLVARAKVVAAMRSVLGSPRLSRGRHANPAADPRGRQRRAVPPHINAYDLDLYLRIAPSSTSNASASEGGEGLRDRPELPQRGRRLQPQPGVH